MFCEFSRHRFDNVSFEFLWPEIREGFWESFREAGTEHDDKLRNRVSMISSTEVRVFVRVSSRGGSGRSGDLLLCPDYLPKRIHEVVKDLVLGVEVKPRL